VEGLAGGRAAVFHEDTIAFAHATPGADARSGIDERFETTAALMVAAFARLGIDARVGEVAGEYCPGAHSVNARGIVKLVGTAQRVVKNAWLFSSLVIVDDADRLREVLTDVHRHLDLPFEASSVGSVRGENPALTLTDVEIAVAQVWDQGWRLRSDVPSALDAAFRELALTLEPSHSTAG
jgi:octanoyl-[GcvH]:protein N-octanoyltransferase